MLSEKDKNRILSKIEKNPVTGCWIWTGGKFSNGYGQVSIKGKKHLVHRVVYEMLKGPIPDGLVLDHDCKVLACANPDHTDPVTQKVNLERGNGPSSRTHCPKGHPYEGDNLIVRKDGHRACRTCNRERDRARQESRRMRQKVYTKIWRAENADKVKAHNQEWYAANRQKAIEYAREYRAKNPEKARESVRLSQWKRKRLPAS